MQDIETQAAAGESLDTVVPLIRRSLHDDLVERLRDMIIEGQLRPGSRINEGQVCKALGVSRTPLREALKYLASEGLVDLVPGRGGIVNKLTPQDVRNMLDVLTALESLAGRRACQSAPTARIAVVRALHNEMMEFYAARNRLEYYKRNQAIHSAIIGLADNDFLAGTHHAIQSRLKRIRFIGNEEPEKWRGAVAEHERMIAALEARDADRLVGALTEHLEKTWERVKDIV